MYIDNLDDIQNRTNGHRYNLVPDGTICQYNTPQGLKHQKLRISVFLTVNTDGSDKRKPMVIGQAAMPHAFKNA